MILISYGIPGWSEFFYVMFGLDKLQENYIDILEVLLRGLTGKMKETNRKIFSIEEIFDVFKEAKKRHERNILIETNQTLGDSVKLSLRFFRTQRVQIEQFASSLTNLQLGDQIFWKTICWGYITKWQQFVVCIFLIFHRKDLVADLACIFCHL